MTKEESKEQDKKDKEEFINELPNKLKDNIKIIESTESQPFVLRIDNRVPKYFEPLVPLSTSSDEDRSLPRVCVSSNLTDAILGIARLPKIFIENNFYNQALDPEVGINKKSNIFHISLIPYNYAVMANEKLLPDVELTNEMWLIGYNKDNQRFYPEVVGHMFITNINITYKEHNNKKPLVYFDCFISIEKDTDVYLKPNRKVSKGYYSLRIEKDNNGDLRLSKIDKKDFDRLSKVVLSKENLQESKNIEYKNSLMDRW